MKRKIILFAITVCITCQAWCQSVIYLSPNGKSMAYSISAPGSIYNLPAKLRALRSTNKNNITIYLKGGTYSLTKPIELTNAEVGGGDTKLLITNAPNEQPTLSGAIVIKGWVPYKNGIYKATVPAGFNTRELYVNGKIAIRARYPNRDNNNDYGPYLRVKAFDAVNKTITISTEGKVNLDDASHAEIVLNQHWYQCRLPFVVNNITENEITITPKEPLSTLFFKRQGHSAQDPGKACYFENAFSLLDDKDEWYLDTNNQTIYYKPKTGQDINKLYICAPVLNNLLNITGTAGNTLNNIEIRHISFAYTTWIEPGANGIITTQGIRNNSVLKSQTGYGAIQASFVNNLSINGCNIYATGAHGILFIKGVKNSSIINNHLHDLAGNAIEIAPFSYNIPILNDSEKFVNILVKNNLIENFGIDYTNGMGIVANCIANLTVQNNEICFGPYMGMQIGDQFGNMDAGVKNNIISNNNIHNVMQLHDDGGAIYTLGNQPGTKIYGNWIHDMGKSKWSDTYPVEAIYLDNNSAYITVQNNVVENMNNVIAVHEHTASNTKITTHDNQILPNNQADNVIKAASGLLKQ